MNFFGPQEIELTNLQEEEYFEEGHLKVKREVLKLQWEFNKQDYPLR